MSDHSTDWKRITIDEANARAYIARHEFEAMPTHVQDHIKAHVQSAGHWEHDPAAERYRNKLITSMVLTFTESALDSLDYAHLIPHLKEQERLAAARASLDYAHLCLPLDGSMPRMWQEQSQAAIERLAAPEACRQCGAPQHREPTGISGVSHIRCARCAIGFARYDPTQAAANAGLEKTAQAIIQDAMRQSLRRAIAPLARQRAPVPGRRADQIIVDDFLGDITDAYIAHGTALRLARVHRTRQARWQADEARRDMRRALHAALTQSTAPATWPTIGTWRQP